MSIAPSPSILKLIAPRIRHFIRQYGLDCPLGRCRAVLRAIAVHRAIEAYDPAKAQFTTFVNWQIRGELQKPALPPDDRPAPLRQEGRGDHGVALPPSPLGADGDEISPEAMIEDEDAVARTEAGASDYLAEGAIAQLIDAYVEQLRKVGIEALPPRPPASSVVARCARGPALCSPRMAATPPSWRSSRPSAAPATARSSRAACSRRHARRALAR